LIGVPLVIITIILVWRSNGNSDLNWADYKSWWGDWFDPILGFSTFLVAMVIWLTNLAKEWEEKIDKKLTVIYKYDNREIFRCKKAYLAHEGDIRNWGQTLGRLAIGKGNDGRDYYFKYSSSRFEKSEKVQHNGNYFYKHYIATFYLTEIPGPEELISGIDLTKGCCVWEENKDTAVFNEDKT